MEEETQRRNDDLPDPDFSEDEEIMDQECPKCRREYDEIDYEFQICHRCGFNNNKSGG